MEKRYDTTDVKKILGLATLLNPCNFGGRKNNTYVTEEAKNELINITTNLHVNIHDQNSSDVYYCTEGQTLSQISHPLFQPLMTSTPHPISSSSNVSMENTLST